MPYVLRLGCGQIQFVGLSELDVFFRSGLVGPDRDAGADLGDWR